MQQVFCYHDIVGRIQSVTIPLRYHITIDLTFITSNGYISHTQIIIPVSAFGDIDNYIVKT